jgi:hypothetical protein
VGKPSRKRPNKHKRLSETELREWRASTIAISLVRTRVGQLDQQIAVLGDERAGAMYAQDAIADAREDFLRNRGIDPDQKFWIENDGVLTFLTAEEYDKRVLEASRPRVEALPPDADADGLPAPPPPAKPVRPKPKEAAS